MTAGKGRHIRAAGQFPSIPGEKGICGTDASSAVPLEQTSQFSQDALTKAIRAGARKLLRTAVQAEVWAFVAEHERFVDDSGRQRLIRRGSLPEREVTAGIGKVAVQVTRVRDRGADQDGRIRFRSSIVPPWQRKAKPVEEPVPWLYLKGMSTGDFGEAPAALLGPDAEGSSASAVTRLKASWAEDCDAWRKMVFSRDALSMHVRTGFISRRALTGTAIACRC